MNWINILSKDKFFIYRLNHFFLQQSGAIVEYQKPNSSLEIRRNLALLSFEILNVTPLVDFTEYECDALENITKIIDANANITKYEYDSHDRLVKEINPLDEEVSFQYDQEGNLLEKTDALLQVTTYNWITQSINMTLKTHSNKSQLPNSSIIMFTMGMI